MSNVDGVSVGMIWSFYKTNIELNYNNEIKAYSGNCHLLYSTKEADINVENSQSENSDRKFKIRKGLESFSSIWNIIFYKTNNYFNIK